MRMVVDFPRRSDPRKPKTSPRCASKLMWSTATKSPKRLTRSRRPRRRDRRSFMRHLPVGSSTGGDEEVLDVGATSFKAVERQSRRLELRSQFGHPARGVIDHQVHAVADQQRVEHAVAPVERVSHATRRREQRRPGPRP